MGDMADLYNELHAEGDSPYRCGAPRRAKCNVCGKFFRWKNMNPRTKTPVWRLVNKKGEIHTHARIAKLSEFPLVD